jgi:hypothetical protein
VNGRPFWTPPRRSGYYSALVPWGHSVQGKLPADVQTSAGIGSHRDSDQDDTEIKV